MSAAGIFSQSPIFLQKMPISYEKLGNVTLLYFIFSFKTTTQLHEAMNLKSSLSEMYWNAAYIPHTRVFVVTILKNGLASLNRSNVYLSMVAYLLFIEPPFSISFFYRERSSFWERCLVTLFLCSVFKLHPSDAVLLESLLLFYLLGVSCHISVFLMSFT